MTSAGVEKHADTNAATVLEARYELKPLPRRGARTRLACLKVPTSQAIAMKVRATFGLAARTEPAREVANITVKAKHGQSSAGCNVAQGECSWEYRVERTSRPEAEQAVRAVDPLRNCC